MSRVLSQQEFERLKKKLEVMIDDELPQLQQALARARERGDLSENAEYDAARQALWFHEARINELQEHLNGAEVVDPTRVDHSKALLGATVVAEDLDGGFEERYILVGHIDEEAAEDAVSVSSPVGQALLGSRVDDVIEVKIPAGTLRLKIREISY